MNSQNLQTTIEQEAIVASLSDILLNKNLLFNSTVQTSKIKIDTTVLQTPLEDYYGNQSTLKDVLKSEKKIILLDFWASWCVPCISELPSLKRMVKQYSNKIKVISISIDTDSVKWRQACNKYVVKDNSYRNVLGKNSLLNKFLQLNSIPRYIILNNNYEIIENDFYRPSASKFSIQLENILSTVK